MRLRPFLATAALLAGLASPGLAAAQTAIAYAVPGLTNMRAGPGAEYPVIARVAGGSTVAVYGCLSDYSWCDSSVQDTRGWISTTRLEFDYGGRLVPIQPNFAYFNAPRIQFDLGYWDQYYSDKPFYRDRDRSRRHHRRNPDPDVKPDVGYIGGTPNFEEDDQRAGRRHGPAPDLSQPSDESLLGGPCIETPNMSACP